MMDTATTLEQVYETPSDGHYFFGYYDKSPLNAGNTRLLAQRSSFINRMPEAGEEIEIGFFDFPDGREFKRLAGTTAWNWQQGSMLQWLGPDFARRVLYNDIREGHYRAVVLEIESGRETVLPMPAYTLSGDGRHALCVDYDRLYWFRPGYNYQGTPRPQKKKAFDPEDGIWRMALDTGKTEKIVSIDDVMSRGRVSAMSEGTHYLEHMMISPSNRRFVFLHRWLNVDGGIFARLFSADLDGGDLHLLNDSGRMSHFCWRDADWVFGYGGMPTPFNRLRGRKRAARHLIRPLLPLYHALFPAGGYVSRQVTGDGYQLFRDRTAERIRIGREILAEDGHPTFQPGNADLIVNDSYPDERGDCRLFLFDVANRVSVAETAVASDPTIRATGYRCDLHPKWSFDGCYVTIDRCTTRGRGMSVFKGPNGLSNGITKQ